MSVTKFLHQRGFLDFEGNIQGCPQQMEDLIQLSANVQGTEFLEIGFNAGHSAELLLKNNPRIHLTSFDLGTHEYVIPAKEYLDQTYPGRHTLILGDSTQTVPDYLQKHPNKKFDLIFIDGGHDYPIAHADLQNCRALAHSNTLVLLDDTIYTSGWEWNWTVGPTQTWKEHQTRGQLIEMDHRDYFPGRGMSWGKYLFHSNPA